MQLRLKDVSLKRLAFRGYILHGGHSQFTTKARDSDRNAAAWSDPSAITLIGKFGLLFSRCESVVTAPAVDPPFRVSFVMHEVQAHEQLWLLQWIRYNRLLSSLEAVAYPHVSDMTDMGYSRSTSATGEYLCPGCMLRQGHCEQVICLE